MDGYNPLISIVLPVYNVEKYVAEALQSLLAQSYQNLQIIVINDGSTDNSENIIQTFTDPRIEIYKKENGGLSSARNEGIRHATGEYLCFIDSDDIIHPQFIEILVKTALETNAQLVRIGLENFYKNNPTYEKLDIKNSATYTVIKSTAEAVYDLYNKETLVATTCAVTKLYARSIYKNIHFPENKLHEDVAVALSVVLEAKKIAEVKQNLYFYRHNPNSIMHTPSWKHTDGIDFYETHYAQLNKIQHPAARTALLCAFKTALQCACDYAANPTTAKDTRYKPLLKRLHNLALKCTLNNLNIQDKLTVLTCRVSPKLTVKIYGLLLQLKKN